MKIRTLLLLIVVIGGVAGAAAMVPTASVQRSATYEFTTRAVDVGDVRKLVITSGTVRPIATVQIGSEVSGRIKAVNVDFNDLVKAGDLLAVIDPKAFESRARQAQADLESAKAEVAQHEATLRKATAVHQSSVRALSRQEELKRKGVSSAALMDTASRDVDVAAADIDVARANIENAKARLAQKQAQLDQAMIDVKRTEIRAAIDGIVLSRAVEVGQTVAASFKAPELFNLAGDLSRVHIEAEVSEADIGLVRQRQKVSFDVDAYPSRTFKGRVVQVRLSPNDDDNIVTYTVVIEAENPNRSLFPGMTANVKIETVKRSNVVRVPVDALRFKPPKDYPTARLKKEDEASGPDALVKLWGRRLDLSNDQVGRIEATLAAAAGSYKNEMSAYRKAFNDLILEISDEKQRMLYLAILGERRTSKATALWLSDVEGRIVQRNVRLGLTDAGFAEIIGDELRAGDRIVIASRRTSE